MNPNLNQIDVLEERLRELQGFLRGLLVDGVISRAEVRALQSWLQRHSAELENQHPFTEIVPYLRVVLRDSDINCSELREELQWMWERLRSIQLRHPSMESDLRVFLGLVQGVLADNQLNPSELQELLLWLDRCPLNAAGNEEHALQHIRQVLHRLYDIEMTYQQLPLSRQYLVYMTRLLAA